MKSTRDRFRTATKKEVEELRRLAVVDLEAAGYSSAGEQAIASCLNTLAAERHLLLPGRVVPEKATRRTTDEFSPGLTLVQDFCQREAHKADQRTWEKREGASGASRTGNISYYFAALPDEYIDHFARYLPPSAALVLWVLWRYSKTSMQTWVSQDTICRKTGLSENTVKRDLKMLKECNIVNRCYASGRDFGGRVIDKTQGYKYRINAPIAWDREQVKRPNWKKPRRRGNCG